MERIVFHIDVNSAFLSWTAKQLLENWYQKDIRDYISAVWVEEKRKCFVLAASTPAKKRWIRTPMRINDARTIYPDIIIAPPDYSYYKKCSNQLMDLLKSKFKVFQQYSIDECFVEYTSDMQELYWDEIRVAYEMKNYIEKKLWFTVNIWIWNNKFLAKMASDFEKPNMVHTLYADEIETKMRPLPIEDLFMCWSKTTEKLKRMWVNRIRDLVDIPREKLVNKLWNHWKLMYDYCRWIDDSKVENTYDDRKSIWASSITRVDTVDIDFISTFFEWFSQELSILLNERNLAWQSITVHVRYSDYTYKSHQRKFQNLIFNSEDIFKNALILFEELRNKKSVNLVWITIWNLIDATYKQYRLF